MKLEITSEKVREAAQQCPNADKVLRTLFPAAFGPKLKHENGVYLLVDEKGEVRPIFEIRNSGEFAHKALYLFNSYDWGMRRDCEGLLCLIPTLK